MFLLDYIVNLSIFSLLVSTPLVIRSFINYRPIKHVRFWVGIYGGIVSIILVMLAIHEQGFSYDIRYAPVILVFAYLGPIAGIITGAFGVTCTIGIKWSLGYCHHRLGSHDDRFYHHLTLY